MDTKKLIQEAKARFKHQESKLYLKEKYTNKLTIANQSGLWTITPEFLSFLSVTKNYQSEIVIKDNYDNPVKVNIEDLENHARTIYNEVMNEWYAEFKLLQKYR